MIWFAGALGFGAGVAGGYATIGTIGFEDRLDYGGVLREYHAELGRAIGALSGQSQCPLVVK